MNQINFAKYDGRLSENAYQERLGNTKQTGHLVQNKKGF